MLQVVCVWAGVLRMLGVLSSRRGIGRVTVVVVVRTNLLNQFVVHAVEGYIYAYHFERFGAQPGNMALRLLLIAHFGRVKIAQSSLLVPVRFLILDAAVEGFRVFCL